MANFGSPVAQNVNVNPTQSLSSLLDLKQKQQALQIGQSQISTAASQAQEAQATASQAQQQNTELSNLAAFTKAAVKDPAYRNADGSTNVQKFQQDAMMAAPVYGQQYIGHATTAFNEGVSNQKALLDLTNEERQPIAAMATKWASTPGITPSQVISDVTNLGQQYQDNPEVSRLFHSITGSMPQDQTKLQGWASGISSEITGVGQLDTTGKNQTGQPFNQNKLTGAVSAAPGVSYPQGLTPSVPQVAGATAAATGGVGIDVDRANSVSAAANNAPGAIRLSQEIDSLADQVGSGKISKAFSSAAAAAGYDPLSYARQLLNKDLGQLKTLASANAPSDARMSTILSGYPEDTSATQTIHTAMDYIRGSFRQSLARGQNLQSFVKANGGPQGFQYSDNALAQSTDPLMHEYRSLAPDQRAGFYTRNFATPQEAQAFKNKVAGAFHGLGQ